MSWARHITRFESLDGSTVVTLPMIEAEVESRQGVRNAIAIAAGLDYAIDMFGTMPAPVDVGTESFRAMVYAPTGAGLDVAIDAIKADAYAIGRGRLYSVGADGSERWAWARVASIPEVSVAAGSYQAVPLIIEWARLSDWFADERTVIEETISANPTTIVVANAGNVTARGITFTIAALGASGFNHPVIRNELTAEEFESTRIAANSSARWRVDTARMAVEYSTDGGGSWVDDYGNFGTGGVQVGFMRLVPGSQNVTVEGVTNGSVTIAFYPAFR